MDKVVSTNHNANMLEANMHLSHTQNGRVRCHHQSSAEKALLLLIRPKTSAGRFWKWLAFPRFKIEPADC